MFHLHKMMHFPKQTKYNEKLQPEWLKANLELHFTSAKCSNALMNETETMTLQLERIYYVHT